MPQTPGSGTRFPTALDDFTMPTPVNYMDIISHAGEHDDINAAVMAVEAKIGTGNTAPALNAIFVGTGAGTSAWTTTPTFNSLAIANGITVSAGGIAVVGDSAINGLLGITGALTLNNYAAHSLLVGEAGSAVVGIAPPATSGLALVSQGNAADPAYSTVVVAGGGTGVIAFTAYAVVCGGITATGAIQQVASLGTNGQVLTSGGPGVLPTWTSLTGGALPDPVTVVHGGTGLTALTAYAVLCGGTTTTANVQPLAALGASGTVLMSNGADALPSFQAISTTKVTVTFATGTTALKSTSSTSFADIDATNLGVTYNTIGGRCIVKAWLNAALIAANADISIAVSVDGVDSNVVGGVSGAVGDAGAQGGIYFEYDAGVLSVASHAFKLRWKVTSGTGNINDGWVASTIKSNMAVYEYV